MGLWAGETREGEGENEAACLEEGETWLKEEVMG